MWHLLSFIIHSNPSADFETDDLPCVGERIQLFEQFLLALNYYWDFGNPTDLNDTSNARRPHYDEYTDRDTFHHHPRQRIGVRMQRHLSRNLYVTTPAGSSLRFRLRPFSEVITPTATVSRRCIAGDTILVLYLIAYSDSINYRFHFRYRFKSRKLATGQFDAADSGPSLPIVNFGINVDEGCPWKLSASTPLYSADSFLTCLPDLIFATPPPPNSNSYHFLTILFQPIPLPLIAKMIACWYCFRKSPLPLDIKAFIGQDTPEGCLPPR